MKTRLLVGLGCLFWLILLTGAIVRARRWGLFFENDILLLAIPVFMIAGTIFLGWIVKHGKRVKLAVACSSFVAVVSAFCWVGIWGESV